MRYVIHISGFCDIREVVPDINCNLGPRGALLTVSGATCLTDCRTMLYNDMECWAAVMINPNNCNLMFYVDPEYCKDDSEAKKGYDVYFKTCYTGKYLYTIHIWLSWHITYNNLLHYQSVCQLR